MDACIRSRYSISLAFCSFFFIFLLRLRLSIKLSSNYWLLDAVRCTAGAATMRTQSELRYKCAQNDKMPFMVHEKPERSIRQSAPRTKKCELFNFLKRLFGVNGAQRIPQIFFERFRCGVTRSHVELRSEEMHADTWCAMQLTKNFGNRFVH